MDRPIGPQLLVAAQDLLDHEVNGPLGGTRRGGSRTGGGAPLRPERLRHSPLQFFEVFVRQIKTVRMIDPQARDRASRDQVEEQPMRFVKNLRQFHPNSREIIDIEEAPVIDFLRRHPPKSEAIGLVAQERIQERRSCGDRPACH